MVLINLSEEPVDIPLDLKDLQMTKALTTDVWTGRSLGVIDRHFTAKAVAAHDCVFLTLSESTVSESTVSPTWRQKSDDAKVDALAHARHAQPPPPPRRGLRWAVSAVAPTESFLLRGNPAHWANSSLSVTAATGGLLQCCFAASSGLVVNRSGHLVTAYPGFDAAFAPFRSAGMRVDVDIGAATGTSEGGCRPADGNCPALG